MYKLLAGGVALSPSDHARLLRLLEHSFKENNLDAFLSVLSHPLDLELPCTNGFPIFQLAYDHYSSTGDRRFLDALLAHGAIGIAYEDPVVRQDLSVEDCVVFINPNTLANLSTIIPSGWLEKSDSMSGTDRIDQFIDERTLKMMALCANPSWWYPTEENAHRHGYTSLDHAYEVLNGQFLNPLGLHIEGAKLCSTDDYSSSTTHAAVFRQLFSKERIPFLILDCALAFHLADLWAYLDHFGDDAFNSFVNIEFDGKPQIVPSKPMTDTESDCLAHYLYMSFPDGTDETSLASFLQHGDLVYIKGVPGFTLFHPGGTAQGLNALVVRPSDFDPVRFVGFHNTDPTPRSYSEVIESLRSSFFQNITYEHLRSIEASSRLLVSGCVDGISHQDVLTLLHQFNGVDAVSSELKVLQQKIRDEQPLDMLTSLVIPPDSTRTPVGITLLGRVVGVSGEDEESSSDSFSHSSSPKGRIALDEDEDGAPLAKRRP